MYKNTIKKSLAIVFAIALCANASAQIAHSVYTSNNGNFQSFVNVYNSVTNETWFVATDNNSNNNRVVVMKMDASPFMPSLTAINAFTLMPPEAGQIYLKSGFFDPEGNIFAYGRIEVNGVPTKGVIMRIVLTSGNVTSTSLKFNTLTAPVEDACWAYASNGTAPNDPVCYGIIFGNKFAKVSNTTAANPFSICAAVECTAAGRTLSSVLYDNLLKGFTVSGYGNNGVFYDYIFNHNNDCNNTTLSIGGIIGGSRDFSSLSLNINSTPNKIVYTGIWNFIMVQPVNIFGSDGLWIIDNNSPSTSAVYRFPMGNVSVIDAKYVNYGNYKYLYVLGNYTGLDNNWQYVSKRYLLKIDINNNIYDTRLLDEGYLNNLEYDYYNAVMRISGAAPNGDSYFVSEVDLFNAYYCDDVITLSKAVFPPSSTGFNGLSLIYPLPTPSFNTMKMTMTAPYSNTNAAWGDCPFGRRAPERPNALTTNYDKQIEVINKEFVISNFEGNCSYKIFDVLGRAIQQGNTQNGVVNNINISTAGIYTINVTDEKNNNVSSKAVIGK